MTMYKTIDLDDLEAKAKAATPGPWKDLGGLVNAAESVVAYEVMPPDRAFIAATNPAAVLELLRRLRVAEAIVGDLAKRDPVQHFPSRCQLCIGHVLADPPDRSMVGAFVHDKTCVYRRAVEATK
jgi:hypothetical protein